jgi:hypothetical protein
MFVAAMSPRTKPSTPTIPFIAKCKTGWKVIGLTGWLMILWFFLGATAKDGRLAVISLREQGGIVDKGGILLLLILIPGILLEIFRARTVFLEEGICHVPTFGRSRRYGYRDIVKLEVFPNEFVRLTYQDGRWLKVWAMRGDPEVVAAIIRTKWEPATNDVLIDPEG